MNILEIRTDLPPAEVFRRARSFFSLAGTPYAAFPEKSGEDFMRLHMEVGEIILGAVRDGETTHVRGSASRGLPLLSRFFTTLGAPLDVGETMSRRGARQVRGSAVIEERKSLANPPAAAPRIPARAA